MKILSDNTKMVITSIGSGKADVQFLFAQDILGDGSSFPRHSKQYADFESLRNQLQIQRVLAFKEYISDVAAGSFPEKNNLVNADIDVENYLKLLVGGKSV